MFLFMSKNKEKNKSKNTTADDLFGKMVAQYLKSAPTYFQIIGYE